MACKARPTCHEALNENTAAALDVEANPARIRVPFPDRYVTHLSISRLSKQSSQEHIQNPISLGHLLGEKLCGIFCVFFERSV